MIHSIKWQSNLTTNYKVKSFVIYWTITHYFLQRITFICCFMELPLTVLLRNDTIYTSSQCQNIQLCFSSTFVVLSPPWRAWQVLSVTILHLFWAGSFLGFDIDVLKMVPLLWSSHLHLGHYLKRWLFLLQNMCNHLSPPSQSGFSRTKMG